MAKILLCAVDNGAYNALDPVAVRLSADRHKILWVTESGKGAANLAERPGRIINDDNDSIAELLAEYQPKVVVAGVSAAGPDLALTLPQVALKAKIPVVKVVDFWGTGMPHEKGFAPTKVCCLQTSRGYEAYQRQLPPADVRVTGGPQFDKLANTKPLSEPAFFERGGSRPFALFIGPSTTERVKELQDILLPALASLRHPLTLGMLWHPKSNPAEYAAGFKAEAANLPLLACLDDQSLRAMAETDVLLATADIVIGATSTELVKACYLRRPTLSILPRGGYNHQVLTARGLGQMPTSHTGATAHAETVAEVLSFFSLFFPATSDNIWSPRSEHMMKSQMLNYKADGRNAERVVDVVSSLL